MGCYNALTVSPSTINMLDETFCMNIPHEKSSTRHMLFAYNFGFATSISKGETYFLVSVFKGMMHLYRLEVLLCRFVSLRRWILCDEIGKLIYEN